MTRLPFPVQVVERVETIDWIGRGRLVTRYAYHHGYYDSYEREFRGFGMVEQWDTEEFRADTSFDDSDFVNWDQRSWSPPVLTRTWFHTGAFDEAAAVAAAYAGEYWTEPALRGPGPSAAEAAMRLPDTVLPDELDPFEAQEAYRALKGRTLRTEVYGCDGSAAAGKPYTVTERNFTLRLVQHRGPNLHAVLYAHPRETLAFRYERGVADPRVSHELTLETDAYGNVLRAVSVGYPRRAWLPTARAGPAGRRPVDARLRPGPAATCGAPSAATPTPSTTPQGGPTTTGSRCSRRLTRPRSPASPLPSAPPGSRTCSRSTTSAAPAASGPPPGRRPATSATSRSRRPTSTGPGRHPPGRPGGSSAGNGSCTGPMTCRRCWDLGYSTRVHCQASRTRPR